MILPEQGDAAIKTNALATTPKTVFRAEELAFGTPAYSVDANTSVESKRTLSHQLFATFYDRNDAVTVRLGDREIIMMGSTNYLGMSHHPSVKEAAISAIMANGIGGLGSRFTNGSLLCHQALDLAMIDFFAKDDCVFFNSGYMANLGAFSAFGRDAIIFSDKENHLSIYDACRLADNKYYRFQHNDPAHLKSLLERHKDHRNKWVVIVGTFGASGENINLKELVTIAKSYGAKIYLDDAHAFGIYGGNRRGLADLNGIYDQIDLIMTSFQMAFGNIGAAIGGKKELIDRIRYLSRLHIFTYTLPVDKVTALLAAVEIVRGPEGAALSAQLVANAKYLRNGFLSAGLKVVSRDGHIVSVRSGSEAVTVAVANDLLARGVWSQVYIHPSVPLGKAIIRFTPIALHSKDHLDTTIAVMTEMAKKYPSLVN